MWEELVSSREVWNQLSLYNVICFHVLDFISKAVVAFELQGVVILLKLRLGLANTAKLIGFSVSLRKRLRARLTLMRSCGA